LIYVRGYEMNFDVMHGHRHLYTIPMMTLYSSEKSLNDGRYRFYDRNPQEYRVSLRFDDASGESFRARFREVVEWIATRAETPWSFHPQPDSVGKMAIDFSFENPTDAVVFKLVWF
jgi:phage-related protein